MKQTESHAVKNRRKRPVVCCNFPFLQRPTRYLFFCVAPAGNVPFKLTFIQHNSILVVDSVVPVRGVVDIYDKRCRGAGGWRGDWLAGDEKRTPIKSAPILSKNGVSWISNLARLRQQLAQRSALAQ